MSRRRSQTNWLKRTFPLILVTTFFFVFASQIAQAQAPRVTSAGDVMTLQYAFGTPTVTRVDPYDSVTIRGLSKIKRAGEPVLPVKPVTVLIPHGRQLTRLEVVPGAKVTLPGRYDVEPGQRPVPLSHTGPVEPTPPAPRIYNTLNPFPGLLNSEAIKQSKRGFRLVVLNLYPVEYVPNQGALSYYREMTVKVHTEAIAVPFNQQRGFKETEKTYIRKIVDNPETAETYPGEFGGETSSSVRGFLAPGDSYQYVIITNEALSASAFTELAADKNARGITAKIVTTEWIYANYDGTRPDGGTDNQTRIRNFIIDAYTTWATEYVLLGGNKDIVPPRLLWVYGGGYTDEMPADLYYGCLDGSFDGDQDGQYGEPNDGPGGGEVDLYHEVYIGRASVANAGEVANFVAKTLDHENASDEYLRLVSMLGEYLGFGGDSQYAKNSMEEIRLGSSNHGYTTMGFEDSPYADLITTHYSEIPGCTGRPPCLYDADGDWPESALIDFVNNGHCGYDGVQILNHLGHANYTYCMKLYTSDLSSLTNSRYFFAYSQGCMPGGFDTVNCFAEEITTMAQGAFAVVMNARYGWGEYNSTDGPSQRYDRPFWHAVFDQGLFELGKANAFSKEHFNVARIDDDCMRWCYYELNLFGDPELRLKIEGEYLTHKSHVIDDDTSGESDGDGDGYVEPGETIEMPVTLRNSTAEDAHNVTAVLSTSDTYVTVLDDTELFGTVPAGEDVACLDDYVFEVDPSCPDDHVISFQLDITADEGTWTSVFTVQVYRHPDIVVSPEAFDVTLAQGEQTTRTLTIENQGIGNLHFDISLGTKSAGSVSTSDGRIWQVSPDRSGAAMTPILAVVLDGIGTWSSGYMIWDDLNADWSQYGSQEIRIDYTTFHGVEITYQGLVQSGADVLIITDNWDPGAYYGAFSESEAEAIAQYVAEGAGLYISGGTFNNAEYTELQTHVDYLAPLVGLSTGESYSWHQGTPGPLRHEAPGHPILRDLPDPYESAWDDCTSLPSGGVWTAAVIPDGTVLGLSENEQTVLVAKGRCVFHSGLPEYYTATESDKQFVYNAITYGGGWTAWMSVDPTTGNVEPGKTTDVTVTFDAANLEAGQYQADIFVNSDDPDEPQVVVPASVQVGEGTFYTITATAGPHGRIDPSGDVSVPEGGDVTFNIVPDQSYQVADVVVDGASVGPVTSYTFEDVTSDHTIDAEFAALSHAITATAGAHGQIQPSGTVDVPHGGSQTFTIMPDVDWQIGDVIVDGQSVGAVGSYTFENVTSDHTIHAEFVVLAHTITATAGTGGTIDPSGSVTVPRGTSRTFYIIPDPDYDIADVLVDGASVGAVPTYEFTGVSADHTIHADFVPRSYTITATAGTGGTIDPSGSVTVPRGTSRTFYIIPDPDYDIADVLVDGASVGAVPTYEFTDVSADHTIEAIFERQIVPDIVVTPEFLEETLPPGGFSLRALTIRNEGGEALSFTLSIEDGSLSHAPNSDAGPSAYANTTQTNRSFQILQANAAVETSDDSLGGEGIDVQVARDVSMARAAENAREEQVRFLPVADPIVAVVLDGIGTWRTDVMIWDDLNTNWSLYGTQPILIDYSTFHGVEITYEGLVQSGADVIIITDNWDAYSMYGAFSESEAAAIVRYVEEGAGLYVSGGTFNNDEYPELQTHVDYLAPLVGLTTGEFYSWHEGIPGSLGHEAPGHPVLRDVLDPYASGWDQCTSLPSDVAWTAGVVPDGTLVGLSENEQTVLVAKGRCLFHSGLPEYYTATTSDKQFLYNMITFAGSGVPWVLVDPVEGRVEPGDEMEITVAFDAGGLSEGTYEADIIVTSNDPDEPDVVVPVTLWVKGAIEPDIRVSPEELDVSIPPDGTVKRTLTITNEGMEDLTFDITSFMTGSAAPAGSGGPDGFGYVWLDSDDPDGPSYEWVEISGVGTEVVLGDDASTEIALPFAFPFYGEEKTSVRISSNGYLTFGDRGKTWRNTGLPYVGTPNDVIAPFWDDLDPDSGSQGRIYHYYDEDHSRFIVEYSDVDHYYPWGHPETFEVILYANGTILFQYQTVSYGGSCTVGIENQDGSDGLEVTYNRTYLHDGLAIELYRAGGWLTFAPRSGTVSSGDSMDVTVTFDATGLEQGLYEADIVVESNDPDEPQVTVFATMEIKEGAFCFIMATADQHGTIEPSGEVTASQGEDVNFAIMPDEGYEIADVLVDGVSVGAVSTYVFENVQGDHKIHATFTE